jgi:uncharacterized protein YuzE
MATVKKKSRKQAIKSALALAEQIETLPANKLWLDHDAGADVLYISLQRPQKATETVEVDDQGLLLHYRGKSLVGITVLDARARQKPANAE